MSREAENTSIGSSKAPIVCYVTDRKNLPTGNSVAALTSSIRVAIAAGVDWVQIREKDLPARDVLALATAAVIAADGHGTTPSAPARVIINDRLDAALAAGASGVHLGHESIPTADVVRWCRSGNAPEGFLIGVSCHGVEDVRRAEAAGATYVIFGPVFETPSKRTFGPPQGIGKLEDVCRSARIPVIAIGGVDVGNAAICLSAGAAGIAAIRLFQGEQSEKALADRISKLHQLSVGPRR